MDIYLIDQNGPELHIPVNPGELTFRRDKLYETINILNLGEVDFPTGEKLQEINFSSFFPAHYDSYCRYSNLPNPNEAMDLLDTWTKERTQVRLLITETSINQLVIISANMGIIKGGEPGDIYYDLSCREWKEIKVRTTKDAAVPGVAAANRPDLKRAPKTYTVVSGDTLCKIAKLNSLDWKSIYDKNVAVIGSNPNLIKPGQKLVLA